MYLGWRAMMPVLQLHRNARTGMPMATETSASFGELLKEHRLAAGLTQEALAERAGISARGIQALERGQSRPQRETARRLAVALGLPPEEQARLLDAATPSPRRRPAGADPFDVLLRRHRVATGLTQEELADRARVSWRGISGPGPPPKYPRKDTRRAPGRAPALGA